MQPESIRARLKQKYHDNKLWASMLILSVISMVGMSVVMSAITWQMHNHVITERKALIQSQIASAAALVNKLYLDVSEGRISEETAKMRALSYLQSMHYPDRGYFWVFDTDGIVLMHPHHPQLVGSNSLELTDARGQFHIQSFIEAARKGGGFSEYYWRHNQTYEPAPKIAYNQLFQPWQWVIGSGLYTTDINQGAIKQVSWGIGLIAMLFLANVTVLLKITGGFISEYKQTAIRDSLTGLFTRQYLHEVGARMLDRSHNGHDILVAIFLDVDQFKAINTEYGAKMGDSILKNIGNTVRLGLRPNEAAFRYAGKQIVILLYGNETHGIQIAQRIRESIAQQQYIADRKHFKVTASAGIAVYTTGEKLSHLLDRAHRCLAKAKAQGENGCISQSTLHH